MAYLSFAVIIWKKKEIVYEALKATEKFPSFLKDVKKISIISGNGNKAVSDWAVDIDGTPIRWRQETIFDDNNQKVIRFKMIDGDYEKYEGEWLLEEVSEGRTRVELRAEFKWGVPGLERFVGDILEEKALVSLKGMLFALRKELQRRR